MTTPLIRPSLVTVPHANVLMGESFASTRAELTLLKNSPHVSVAIVGSGACGLTAALMLKDKLAYNALAASPFLTVASSAGGMTMPGVLRDDPP